MQKDALILLVDDEPGNLRLLRALLDSEGYASIAEENGPAALRRLEGVLPDLILLDLMMPGMDGCEVAHRIKQNERTRNIPILMLTALDDRAARLRALEAGAEEFLNKPLDRAELLVRVRNLLRLKEYQDFLSGYNRRLEEQVAERTRQLQDAYRDTIYTMVRAMEYKDEETGEHVQRISFYCLEVAEYLGMDKAFCDEIFYSSPMHDIGKIAIPDAILLKPGQFTPQEWSIMRGHCAFGAQILERGHSPYLSMGIDIALNHHERWDGTGYPHGKKAEEIPLAARIMNICDQYDALRSKRPYKEAMSHEDALDILSMGGGSTRPEHFDPQILNAFFRIDNRMRDIYQAHA
jgi:putative two-component system response regulator